MIDAEQFLEHLDLAFQKPYLFALRGCLRLLLFQLRLLFLKSVDEKCGELIVFDAFDLALVVAGRQQRFDLRDLFGGQTVQVVPYFYSGENLARALNGGKQERDRDGDCRDDNEKLDEREAPHLFSISFAP